VVAGFEPFDGRPRNRSWDVVRRLGVRPGLEILRLPVNFAGLKRAVPDLTSRKMRVILLVGESSGDAIAVEQVALNIIDTDIPDNSGRTPRAETIVADGPLALRTSWDAKAVARTLNRSGLPAAASFHAGTYACNAALYLAIHARHDTQVGFLHIPHRRWPFGLRLGVLLRAVELGLEALTGAEHGGPDRAAWQA
jgi:pyroglutamyl-peptidase